ncbi:LysR family transcriptional regulator [Photobacterium gaetbulicola]|uniref:LysR family transcriptional regulator n=1 Tax=Photobacterium gaetbulicola TaxID=1295392 RepID=UPI00068EFBBB|nr:LysR family transcriptional regulator [Photobacterium gaetbulicola]
MHSIDQVSSFVAVYDCGSYSAAAKKKNKSRATIREHIQSYEDILGYELFKIEGKKATPTENANRLIKRARLLVRQHESLYSHGISLIERPVSEVNLCFDTVTPTELITAIDRYVRETFPYLNINWIHRNREQALEGLISGEFDIALLPAVGNVIIDKNVTWNSLGIVSMGIFTRKDSPLVSKENLTIEELLNETHLLSEAQADLDNSLTGFKVAPNASLISNNDLLLELLTKTGWALIPKFYIKNCGQRDELVEIFLDEISKGYTVTLNTFFTHAKAQEEPYASILKFAQQNFK